MNINNQIKILAINGLTRSGTNLLSSLIAAQDNCISNEFAITELPFMMEFCNWKENKKRVYINSSNLENVDKNLNKFINHFIDYGLKSIYPSSKDLENKYKELSSDHYGIKNEQWIKYLYEFYECKTLDDFQHKYLNFAKKNEINLLATRVTASTSYAEIFLKRNKNFFWVEVVRDPLARFYSAKRAHSILPEDSFWQSRNQQNIIKDINSDRFIVVDYNQLVSDPKNTIDFLFKKIDFKLKNINLLGVNPNLKSFFGNSSDNKEVFFQDTKRDSIYKSSLKAYEGNISIYDKSIAKYYGFKTNINIILFGLAMLLFFINNLILVIAKVFSLFSIFFKIFSIILEYLLYFSKRGYNFKSSILRIYSNQKSRLKKWF